MTKDGNTLLDDLRREFINAYNTYAGVVIPWGGDGVIVVTQIPVAWTVGVYSSAEWEAGDVMDAVSYELHTSQVLLLVENLTELQPEETDWVAWAQMYITDIWPDVR